MVRHDLLYLWIMFLEKVCKTELRICGLLSEPFIKQEFSFIFYKNSIIVEKAFSLSLILII